MVSFGATVNFIVLSVLALAPTAIQAAPAMSASLAHLIAVNAANQAAAQDLANRQRMADDLNKMLKKAADNANGYI